jgi:hypothetical protein
MAGTIVADQLQDGAGNSTSMDNAIYGSAKAWARFNGTAATINASYNVSSITRTAIGAYTINFTNAFSDTNYSCLVTGTYGACTNFANVAPTTSVAPVVTFNTTTGANLDSAFVSVAFFR